MKLQSALLYFGFSLPENHDLSDLFLKTYNLERVFFAERDYLAKKVEPEPILLGDLELLNDHLKSLFVDPMPNCELFVKIDDR